MNLNKKIFALDEYIDQALYNPKDGYYMKNNPFGEKGDFITSPNVSILFSEITFSWPASFWKNTFFSGSSIIKESKALSISSEMHWIAEKLICPSIGRMLGEGVKSISWFTIFKYFFKYKCLSLY